MNLNTMTDDELRKAMHRNRRKERTLSIPDDLDTIRRLNREHSAMVQEWRRRTPPLIDCVRSFIARY